jgi:hypothetical protein
MFPHIFSIRRAVVFLGNPSKHYQLFQENILLQVPLSEKGLHFLMIRLLTMNDDMVPFLECDLVSPSAVEKLISIYIFLSLSLRISLFGGKSTSYLLQCRAL